MLEIFCEEQRFRCNSMKVEYFRPWSSLIYFEANNFDIRRWFWTTIESKILFSHSTIPFSRKWLETWNHITAMGASKSIFENDVESSWAFVLNGQWLGWNGYADQIKGHPKKHFSDMKAPRGVGFFHCIPKAKMRSLIAKKEKNNNFWLILQWFSGKKFPNQILKIFNAIVN